jgi:hypothetical protein
MEERLMISFLIRRALGPGVGGFWVGMTMVVTGIALTVFSAAISEALGFHVTLVFYGLVVIGLVRMAAGVPALFSGGGGRRAHDTSGPAMLSYYAPPSQMPAGYCWQCGARVKRRASMCLQCGATQAAEKKGESEVARHSGFGQFDDADMIPPMIPPQVHVPATNEPRRPAKGYGEEGYGPNKPMRGNRDEGYGPSQPARGYGEGGYGPGRPARGDSEEGYGPNRPVRGYGEEGYGPNQPARRYRGGNGGGHGNSQSRNGSWS